jgi:hypothetical protein
MSEATTGSFVPTPRRARRLVVQAGPAGHVLALLLVIVLTQRLAIPLGGSIQLAVAVPLCLVVIGHGLVTRQLQLDGVRARLYALAMAGMVGVTVVASARQQSPALTSIFLVIALYAPLAIAAPTLSRTELTRIVDVFVVVMVIGATLALIQFAIQYLGVPGRDWLATLIPPDYLLRGYHTGDPLEYGSPIIRANGIVFLEPSFLSYFLGLAAVVALWRGRGPITMGVLLLGIVPTSAGNGLVILALGVAMILVGPRVRNLGALLLPAAAAVSLALATPFGARFAARASEFGQKGASANLRIIEPYVRFQKIWLDDSFAIILGHGAGSGPGLVNPLGTDGLLTPLLPKLVLEYGVFATGVFLLFLLWALLEGGGDRPWTLGLLVSYTVVNAAFLQPTLALATILFVHLLRGPADERRSLHGHFASFPRRRVEMHVTST